MNSYDPGSREHVSAVRGRWLEAALSTEPLRPEAAHAAVAQAYRAAGLEPPALVLTARSPIGGALIAAALEAMPIGSDGLTAGDFVGRQVNTAVVDAVTESLGAQRVSRRRVHGIVWDEAKDDIWKPLVRRVRRSLLVPLLAMDADSNDDLAEDLAQGGRFEASAARLADTLDRRLGEPAPDTLSLHAISRTAGRFPPALPDGVVDEVNARFDGQFARAVPGCMEVHVLAYLEYLRAFDGIDQRAHDIEGLCGVARESGPWWPFERAAVLTERPAALHLDGNGRPHCADGPAIAYRDGWELYAWHGEFLPLRVIMRDWRLGDLLDDTGLDDGAKRCAIERSGWDWLLEQTGTGSLASAPDPEQPGERIDLCELPQRLTDLMVSSGLYDDADFNLATARFLVYTAEGNRLGLAVDGELEDPTEAAASLPDWADAEFNSRSQ